MIKLAFCDDELSALHAFQTLLESYRADRGLEIEYTAFHSPLDLLVDFERGSRYDILFLDVLMPGETGIDAAAEIRRLDGSVKIIFLTSSAEFAVESYTVGAFFYQLKPLRKENLYQVMDAALAACEKERASSLILQCKSGITRVDPRRVEYCEVIHRTLLIRLSSGKVLESSGSLDELSRQLLPYGSFLRVHRSYLVNMDHVQSLSYKAITMNCQTEIPIPRGKYNEIKNAFLEYAFKNGQVTL